MIGEPKGIIQVVLERGLGHENLKSDCKAKQKRHGMTTDGKYCCAVGALYHCDDFSVGNAIESSILYNAVKEAGHIFLLLPKYHCELAPIERCWNFSKRYCRTHCTYSLTGLLKNIPISIKLVDKYKIWQFFNRCFKIGQLYLDDATLGEVLQWQKDRVNMHKKIQYDKVKESPESSNEYRELIANRLQKRKAQVLLKADAVRTKRKHRGCSKRVDSAVDLFR